jgi:hypothetical protein
MGGKVTPMYDLFLGDGAYHQISKQSTVWLFKICSYFLMDIDDEMLVITHCSCYNI